jgi:signal transduction histidine kinase
MGRSAGRSPYVALMLACLAGVTVASIASATRSRGELLDRFRREQSKLCADAARAITARLVAVDRDARFLTGLVRRARNAGAATPNEELVSTFRALAIATNPYRALVASAGSGRTPVSATDPLVDQDTARLLIAESQALAGRLEAAGQDHTVEAHVLRGSPFWLFARRAGAAQTLVLAVDTEALLADVLPAAPTSGRLLFLDATQTAWTSCGAAASCRTFPTAESPPELRAARVPENPVAPSPALGLTARRVLWTTADASTAAGPFRVALAAPTDALEQQQSAALWRLLLTTAGAVSVVLVFGGLALRQQLLTATLGARLRNAEELAHARERSEKILDNAPLGIAGISGEGRAVFANRFLRRRLEGDTGKAPASAEVPAALVEWLEDIRDLSGRALASEQIVPFSGTDVATTVDPMRDVEARIIPLDHPIEDLAALILIQDLSVVRELERQLIRVEKLITVGVLSAGIAHEIGTPLMIIRGRAEFVLERDRDSSVAEDLRAIIEQIDDMTATIQRVLDFARPRHPETRPTDARQAAAAAADLLRWRLAKRRIAVDVAASEQAAVVAADPQQLQQVFLNLLTNAADASPDGGTIRIELEPDPERRGYVRIAVEDHGTGIAPDRLNAVFDPYFTTKPFGKGTGLGLAVVAHIVRSHGAQISMRSALGAGTTAVLQWPETGPRGAGADTQ